jgi:hypothetical protein
MLTVVHDPQVANDETAGHRSLLDEIVRDGAWQMLAAALKAEVAADAAGYTHFRDRYRDMAKTLGFEGHIAWAEAML